MSPSTWPSESELFVIAKCWQAEHRMLNAYAEYNLRFMDSLERSTQGESDVHRLRDMRDAFTRFREARSRVIDRLRELEAELEHCQTHLGWLAELGEGERLDKTAVERGWHAFTYLLQAMPLDMAMQVGRIPVTAEARSADCFAAGEPRERGCEPAPSEAHHLITLVNWLKSKNYAPKIGSPAWTLLLETMRMIQDCADTRCQEHEVEARAVERDLQLLERSTDLKLALIPEPKDLPSV